MRIFLFFYLFGSIYSFFHHHTLKTNAFLNHRILKVSSSLPNTSEEDTKTLNLIRLFENQMKKDPRNSELQYNIGLLYLQSNIDNKEDLALNYFKQSMSLNPNK